MTKHAHSAPLETIWSGICEEARQIKATEPALALFVQDVILSEQSILPSIAKILSVKLASAAVPAKTLHETFTAVYRAMPELEQAVQHDLASVRHNDPAASYDIITPFLFFKGFHALQTHRHAHWLWKQERRHLALHLQSRSSEQFGVDIHPAAVIGHGVMLDHATGITIGETSVIENDVLIWHGVTLGSKSLDRGDRHPKIRQGAHIYAGSSVLGATEVGAGARVAAGSIVLDHVPPGVIVAGIPAKIVGKT